MSSAAQLKKRLRRSFTQGLKPTQMDQGDSHKLVNNQPAQTSTDKQDPIRALPPTNNRSELSTQDRLTLLEEVLAEVEAQSASALSQAAPQVALEKTDDLNPDQVMGVGLKEAEASTRPEISPAESGAGLQQVEYEKTPEIPVEVESYLTSVEEDQSKSPPEIAIADGSLQTSGQQKSIKKPVVVLPITPEEEAAGQKKSVHWSIRWLVEWSRRLMKIFKGEIIYRQESTAS